MVDTVLIDTLNLRARDFAVRWKDYVRESPQLKHYNELDDFILVEADMPFYSLLARTLDKGMDLSVIGEFFVALGRRRMRDGFPISEVIFAINLFQRTIVEYLMTEFAPESPERMKQSMWVLTKLAEFCMLGSFYTYKGFTDGMFTSMNVPERVSEELLGKYFKDDFVSDGGFKD